MHHDAQRVGRGEIEVEVVNLRKAMAQRLSECPGKSDDRRYRPMKTSHVPRLTLAAPATSWAHYGTLRRAMGTLVITIATQVCKMEASLQIPVIGLIRCVGQVMVAHTEGAR